MTHKEPKLVIVHWQDAECDTGWDTRDETDIKEPVIVKSVGWLVAENKHTLLIAADVDKKAEDTNTNRPMSIPRCCVRSVHRIKQGAKLPCST